MYINYCCLQIDRVFTSVLLLCKTDVKIEELMIKVDIDVSLAEAVHSS
jgi:hypothetical protein